MFELIKLPYERNALEPYMSEETLDYHYAKHHQTYVDNLNKLISGTEFEWKDLEDIIKNSEGGIFNNSGQIWNHNLFWNVMSPNGGWNPTWEIATLISRDFWDFETFKEKFTASAVGNFGSGWTWLVMNDEGKLEIMNTSNADNPLTVGKKALIGIDVWEHAYYLDVRNARPKYLENFFNLINWDYVNENLK